MARSRLQSRADGLAARVEGLAEALHASGVAEEASAELLWRASAAVLQALNLELLLEQPTPAAGTQLGLEPDVRLAA